MRQRIDKYRMQFAVQQQQAALEAAATGMRRSAAQHNTQAKKESG
jgi:hypothetical protein